MKMGKAGEGARSWGLEDDLKVRGGARLNAGERCGLLGAGSSGQEDDLGGRWCDL